MKTKAAIAYAAGKPLEIVTLDLDGPSAPQKTPKGGTISGFSASGKISRKDFEFGTKSAANAAVGDEVKFTLDVEIDKQ